MKRSIDAFYLLSGLLLLTGSIYAQQTVEQLRLKEFRYQEITGIGYEEGIYRRDPSDIIKVNDTCYVYYTKICGQTSGYHGRIWCAISVDEGFNWQEIGEVLGIGEAGEFDSYAVFTPNIIYWNGKYYLYYTGVKPTDGTNTFMNNMNSDYTAIGVSVSESPTGPFKRISNNPILTVSKKKDAFDSYRIDDASLLYRDEKIWLYYKGRCYNDFREGPRNTHMGVAFSESPLGPFVKHISPLLDRSHEVMIWPYKEGVCALASFSSTIEYASDGLDFNMHGTGIYKQNRPCAPGMYRPDLIGCSEVTKSGLEWGISMILQNGKCYLTRFSFE